MKKDILINLDDFKEFYSIELDLLPNASFSIDIKETLYNIQIQTLANDNTYITISKDNKTLCSLANIKLGVDLVFCSEEKGAFFFLSKNKVEYTHLNYTSFKDIGLFYAI